ncbi:WSC domain-containing protein [Lactarius sanguifluus]|nr:WSC domain-containing protein [Lactarius sanguifluus]
MIHFTHLLPTGFQLAVILTIVPFMYANPTSLGCIEAHCPTPNHIRDDPSDRILTSATFKDSAHMTVESCVKFCNHRKYLYAGLENGEDCYCGNYLAESAYVGLPPECSVKCPGNSNEICGAGHHLSLYWSGAGPAPTISSNVGEWKFLACYADPKSDLDNLKPTSVTDGRHHMTVASCGAECRRSGYPLAGMEFGRDCYCDDGGTLIDIPIPSENCMLACFGNSTEVCGGPHTLTWYYLD